MGKCGPVQENILRALTSPESIDIRSATCVHFNVFADWVCPSARAHVFSDLIPPIFASHCSFSQHLDYAVIVRFDPVASATIAPIVDNYESIWYLIIWIINFMFNSIYIIVSQLFPLSSFRFLCGRLLLFIFLFHSSSYL